MSPSSKSQNLPRQLGYRMPAEWETHEATWLSWPHNEETWPQEMMSRIWKLYGDLVKELGKKEDVHINVRDLEMENRVRSLLEAEQVPAFRVRFHHFPTEDAWVRDHGPIFITRPREAENPRLILDWDYNSWGGKYPPYDLDNAIPARIARELKIPKRVPGMVLEGGSIEVNGQGTLLTTESCLLNPNRNPGLSKAQLESRLKDYLGVEQILWLGEGIAGDDTDGHVDDITRFVNPRTLVTVVEEDPADLNYRPLQDNLLRLQSMTDPSGRPFEVVSLPMPEPLFHQGRRIPASYANFYIANGVVLVPVFQCPRDGEALETLRSLFPDRRVRGVDCRELVVGLGGIHCITQQQPALS